MARRTDAAQQMAMEIDSKIIEQTVEEVMHNSMIPYSEYVILDRALPRVEDGLKPVQRRILYAMYEMGLTSDKPYKKCARIVGDCLGKYHPHGDTSVYDALVRMAQDFVINAPLVDGQGNFGTVDGDPAAAMRYTEARLSALSLEMLKDIDKDTVGWAPNFDDSLVEPMTLPCKYPNLLVNGASGIAVGLATSIPPHNLGEVIDGAMAMIDNPRISLDEIMRYIPAPDFPTGGLLFPTSDMRNAYLTGKGKVVMRARVTIEKVENDKKNLVITALPYQVNKANLLQEIVRLQENQKEKDKNGMLSYISEIVDESNRNGMRAIIKLKRGADVQGILNFLYAKTKLQDNFNLNMFAIAGGKPRQMGLVEMLKYYVDYQRSVILKRSQFELKQAKKKAEITEGLLTAIANIDKIIRILKNADNATAAKATLRQTFGFTEDQVQAIMEMRLGRLVKLEADKLLEELKNLKELIEKLQQIIATRRLQNEVMKAELKEVKRKYKSPRRSIIVNEESPDLKSNPVKDTTEIVREGVLVLEKNGNFRCVLEKSYNMAMTNAATSTHSDVVLQAVKFNTEMNIYGFTDYGNCVRLYLANYELKRFKDKGDKLNTVTSDCKPDEKLIKIFASKDEPKGSLYFLTEHGMIKKTAWSQYNLSKDYYQAIKLSEGDKVVSVEEVQDGKTLLFVTEQGMWLNAETNDIPEQGRLAGGVIGMQLQTNDKVIYASQVTDDGEVVVMTDRGFAKKLYTGMLEPSKRYRKGGKLFDLFGRNGSRVIFAKYVLTPTNVYLLLENDEVAVVNSEDIMIESKLSKGKSILPKTAGDLLSVV